MLHKPSSRTIVITSILIVFATIAVSARWRSGINAALSAEAALAPPSSVLTTVPVSLPNVTAAQGSIAIVPVTVGDLTGLVVTAYELQVTFDPTVLQPANPPFDRAGTVSNGIAVNSNSSHAGHLIIVAYQPTNLAGSGTLINLRFNVVGATGRSTTLIFEDFTGPNQQVHAGCIFNEGIPLSVTSNGSLTVGGATPTASPTPTATNQATPTASPLLPVQAALPDVNAAPGSTISIPVSISDVTGFGVRAYEMQVSYDPAVVQPASPAFDLTGTVGEGMFPFPLTINAGHLIIQALSHGPAISGSGVMLYLRFTVVGTTGQSTELRLENWTNPANHFYPGFMFNEGYPSRTTTNGSVTVADMAIAGNVTYGNTSATRFVPDVRLGGIGSVYNVAMTGEDDGVYLLSGFGAGSYTVTPSKIGGLNAAISSFDAGRIAQHVAGTSQLTGNQLIVADVSGNGTLSSFDAGNIARYVAAIPGSGSTGNWIFAPASRSYASVGSIISNENYSALLMGEVSGNWAINSARRAIANGPRRGARVELPQMSTSVGKDVVIPVNVKGVSDRGVIAYEFNLRYDPSVMQPEKDAVDVAGTVSRSLTVVTNAYEPGLLRVVVYGPMPINSDGVLLNLRFSAIGKAGSVSPLTWERIMFNEGEPRVSTTDGKLELF